MGTRSNNALIVRKNHTVPAAVREFFDVAVYVQHPDAHLWVWETNLAPLHARHGVRDLEEEVAILGWMLSLPERDYKFVRCGEVDLGERGAWVDHPFKENPPDALRSVLEQFEQEEAEIMAVVTEEEPSMHALTILMNVRTQLVEGVRAAINALGTGLNIQRGYADGLWGVSVRHDRSLQLSGYAAELMSEVKSLEQLPLADLVQLLETGQRQLNRAKN